MIISRTSWITGLTTSWTTLWLEKFINIFSYLWMTLCNKYLPMRLICWKYTKLDVNKMWINSYKWTSVYLGTKRVPPVGPGLGCDSVAHLDDWQQYENEPGREVGLARPRSLVVHLHRCLHHYVHPCSSHHRSHLKTILHHHMKDHQMSHSYRKTTSHKVRQRCPLPPGLNTLNTAHDQMDQSVEVLIEWLEVRIQTLLLPWT